MLHLLLTNYSEKNLFWFFGNYILLFLVRIKIKNAGVPLALPNFIPCLYMFFHTMSTPLHNYDLLGVEILPFDDP